MRETELSKEKQIEEMAKITKEHCELDNQCGSCHWSTCNECLSEVLYNAGYRKQSEGVWVDIRERYCKCSNCGTAFEALPTTFMFKENNIFCRHCGSHMKGGAE